MRGLDKLGNVDHEVKRGNFGLYLPVYVVKLIGVNETKPCAVCCGDGSHDCCSCGGLIIDSDSLYVRLYGEMACRSRDVSVAAPNECCVESFLNTDDDVNDCGR